jgi:hypothetical protein
MPDADKSFDKVQIPQDEIMIGLTSFLMSVIIARQVFSLSGKPPTPAQSKEVFEVAAEDLFKTLSNYGVELTQGAEQ